MSDFHDWRHVLVQAEGGKHTHLVSWHRFKRHQPLLKVQTLCGVYLYPRLFCRPAVVEALSCPRCCKRAIEAYSEAEALSCPARG